MPSQIVEQSHISDIVLLSYCHKLIILWDVTW